jgi:ubiquinone/menaquinone biosynthesis C-methylase UbiE
MDSRQFKGGAERLHAPERLALLEIDRVVRLALEGLTARSVLDVGTGTGLFAEAFAKAGMSASGIDTNPALLEVARGRLPGVSFHEGAAEKLPFPDGSFDVVFLGHVLHETDRPLPALEEARRTAASRVVVLEWPYREEAQGPPLDHRLQPEAILALAEKAGFGSAERIELQHMDLYRLASGE